jgi:DUF1680 family protein
VPDDTAAASVPGLVSPAGGPVRPTASAAVAHRPLDGGGARLTGGLLADWQERNRAASLPLAMRQLDAAGNLANLQMAISGPAAGSGPAMAKPGADGAWVGGSGYRGPAFMDSDVYKTLEAISWEIGRSPEPGIGAFAADVTALLAKAQQPDGYLNSWVQVTGRPRYSHLEYSHELYCAGHLIQAAVANSRATGETRLLQVARYFANHLVDTFLGQGGGLDGHPIVETALAELYRETGEAGYLALAAQFVTARGHKTIGDSGFGVRYLQDHEPVRESATEVGHAVRAVYLEAGVADVAAENNDAELLAGSVARWADMVANKSSLTGAIGSRHSGESFGDAFELPPDRAYNETCASIAAFQWSWRLLLATGEAKYADHMERLLYNGFAASLSTDGQRFFYVNPLQRRADHFEEDDPGRRRQWFSCACCPPNIMRLTASLGHYLATVAGPVLYLQLLTGCELTAQLPDGPLGVKAETRYPWAGTAEITVTAAPQSESGLAVRVPSWAGQVSARVNGRPQGTRPGTDGYLVIRRRWRTGDVLSVSMDTAPRLTYPSRRIDALRGTAAVERGPLVYCFEQADQPAATDLEDLALIPGSLTEQAAEPDGIGPTITVGATAAVLPPAGHGAAPYAAVPDPDGPAAAATAVAIPYFQWDNRDGRAMRVWLPLHTALPAAPPSAGSPDAPEAGPVQPEDPR